MGISNNVFEIFISKAGSLPGVKVDREEYLRKTFHRKCETKEKLNAIIQKGPIGAGVPLKEVGKIADQAITNETISTTGISFVTGIPGGLFMGIAIPGDVLQFYVHILIIVQKLMYLYGWEDDVFDSAGNIDDETMNVLILYVGTMFGIKTASATLVKLAAVNTAKMARGVIVKNIMKGGVSRTLIKKLVKAIGIKSTVKGAFKVGTKAVPVISAVLSGAITMASFVPMTKKLKKYLETGQIDNIDKETEVEEILK